MNSALAGLCVIRFSIRRGMALGALYKKALPSSINETILHFPPKIGEKSFFKYYNQIRSRAENLPL